MATPEQAPFPRLVDYLRSSFKTTELIKIPNGIAELFKQTSAPFEDTGLRELLKLFDSANQKNRLRLEPEAFYLLVQIVFRLSPSLLQQKFLCLLRAPYKAADLTAVPLWRTTVSRRLVPCLLRLLRKGSLSEKLLVVASQFIISLLDHETKRIIFDGEDALLRTLGAIVSTHKNYVLRVAVANVIREFLSADGFDRHDFWPEDTPATSYANFPLANTADAGWLVHIMGFVSEDMAARGFRGNSPAVFHVQYTEVKSAALAVVSNELTLIVAADYHTVRFVELPLADGMACVNGLDSTLGVQYRKKTGHQICEGVIMAIERVELVFKDDSQGAAFAESIRNRLVSKSQDELSPDLPQVPRRMSHASIDMSRSRETSTESTSESDRNNRSIESPLDSDTQLLETTPQTRQAQPDERELPHLPPLIPLRQATKTHEHLTGLVDEEDPIDLEELAQQAVSHSSIKTRPLTKSPEQPKLHLPTIRITQTKNMPPGDATTVSTSQTGKHSEELEKDSQRRLKRPGGKDAGNTSTSQVDWDEDLRAEEIESEAPAAKRPKTTSQQTKKSQAATKSKAGKASNTKKTTGNPMPQASDKNRTKPVSGKTVASTRARRSAAAKPTTYEEDSESDHDKDREQDGLVQVQNSNPTPSEKATSKSEKKQVSDSQGQDKSRQSSSDDLDELRVLDEPRSSDIAPVHPLGKEDHEPDQTAHDSHPLDNFQKAQAPDRNDTSFGSKMLQMLGKELQPVAAPSARNSFGNAKSFVQTVNDTRSSSPLKPPTKDARNSLSEADTHMKSAPVAVRETSESTEGLVTAHTNVHPFEDPPEVGHSNEPTIQAEDVDTVHETGDIEHVLQAPATNVDDGVIVVKKITYQKTVTTTINTSDGDDKGDRHIGTEDQKALPSIITAKPAGTGKKWLSRSSLPSCTLEEVPDTSESRRSMAPPKRPSRAQRQSDTAPAKSTIIEGDQSSILTDERVQKKTSIVSFDAQGPRNQGIPSPIKPPNSAEKPVDAPPETGRHAASKRPSFAEPPNLSLTKSTSPQAELTSDNVAAEVSEINEDDEEGILVLEDSAFEPTAREEVTSNALGRNAKQAKASNKDSSKSNNWGRNASQGSKVDENGSPRLHQIQNSRTSILTEQTTSELSESSPVASEDRENSEYTNESGSSPAHRATESLPNITPLQPKVMMRKPRGSLGLTSLTSQTFSKAAPVINTAIFKQSAKSVLYKPPVVVENTVKKAIEKAKPRKANAKDDQEKDKGGGRLEIPISQQPAVSSSSTMLPRLETDTGVVRLGPKTPAERAKEDPKTSPTPASFQTEFKNMLMPPPPLPFPKLKNPDVVVAQTEQGKRRRRPTTEDADLTLVDEEDFAEPRPARPAARSRQRPSPDSSSDSDSSRLRSTPPLGTANMDREICRVATRPTQENLHATLGSLINQVLFRLQAAEQAIECKANEYLMGTQVVINTLTDTYDALFDHERSRAAPRNAGLCETYSRVIEETSDGMKKTDRGSNLSILLSKIVKRRKYMLSLIEAQTEGSEASEQEVE